MARAIHEVYLNLTIYNKDGVVEGWLENVTECSNSLELWKTSLPPALRHDGLKDAHMRASKILPSTLALNAYYCALKIHLHGLLGCPSSPGYASQRKDYYHQICLNTLKELDAIIRHVNGRSFEQLGWPYAWSLWVALRYLLATEYYHGQRIQEEWTALSRSLRSMRRQWQVAGKYWTLLERAFQELRSESPGMPSDTQRILPYMVDLRVSTADLEDRFRSCSALSGK